MAERTWPFRLANWKLSFDDLYFTATLMNVYMLVQETGGQGASSDFDVIVGALVDRIYEMATHDCAAQYSTIFVPPEPLNHH